MTLFFLFAALLVAICLSWLLVGVFRSSQDFTDQQAVNIKLAKERRATLDTALANGAIDQETHDYEREQLEYDLAADLRLEGQSRPRKGGHLTAAAIVAVFIPIAAGVLYLQLGNPSAITLVRESGRSAVAGGAVTGGAAANGSTADAAARNGEAQANLAMADLLPQLEARLADSPDDVAGWRLLGRSYLSINEFAKARTALERAIELDGNDVNTLAQLAESIAMVQEGDLSGDPLKYLQRANTLEPDHEHTLWLLSIAQQQAGDHVAALEGFDKLASLTAGNPDALATINQMRSRSREVLGLPPLPAASPGMTPAAPASAGQEAGADGGTSAASIEVSVSLGDAALAAAKPDTTVFIFARASSGPPMPLAVSRVTVADLPVTVTLDDSMAMVPNMTLSAFPEVTIGARVSPSGNPIAQSGDWAAEQNNIAVQDTDNIALTINAQLP